MPRFDPQLGPDVAALLEHHRAQPKVTFTEHLASLEEGVARQALAKARAYLDLRYWIFLRDADLGRPQRRVHAKLLDAMVGAVGSGTMICPITESVFFELDRQGDTDRRMATVRMIDRLSQGIVIKNSLDRFRCEVTDLFEAVIIRHQLPERPCRNVWVRPYSFLGTPRIKGWGEAEDLAINKAFLAYMWTRSLEDLLTDTPVPDDVCDVSSRDTARRITESSAKFESQMRSFAQVLDAETFGLIDAHRAEIIHAFRPYMTALLPTASNVDFSDGSDAARACLGLVCSAASNKKPNLALPLIRILAGLHAFIRWQRRRPFKFQDFFDLRHAAAAIPYCDVFLTETFLKTACTSTLLDFGRSFGTRIISDEEEALGGDSGDQRWGNPGQMKRVALVGSGHGTGGLTLR